MVIVIAHELFLALLSVQNIIKIFKTLGCLPSREVFWVVPIGSFCPKFYYYFIFILQTRKDQKWDHMKMSFDYFQIQKWMLQEVFFFLSFFCKSFYIAFYPCYVSVCKNLQKTIVLSSGPFLQVFTFTIQCICNLGWSESSPSDAIP